MSYSEIIEGLHERFATIEGLVNVLAYVPTAIHDTPTLYTLLQDAEVTQNGQVTTYRYRIEHRIAFRWQDNEQAELELIPFVNSIPAAVKADPHLGGRLTSGYAQIVEISADWREHAGVTYRTLEFISEVVEKEVS